MPLPATPGSYNLFLPPFPIPLTVVLGPPPLSELTVAGLTAPYDPVDDGWSYGPMTAISCKGARWEAVVPNKDGLPVVLGGPCVKKP